MSNTLLSSKGSLSDATMQTRHAPLLVLESHPVQYRAPLWRKIHELVPGGIHVAYASDFSMRGYVDKDFGRGIRWDTPLLDGYSYTILCPSRSAKGFSYAKALSCLIGQLKPRALLFTTLSSFRDAQAVFLARSMGIPMWLRTETQDEAYERSALKTKLRRTLYRPLYRLIDRFFYIGRLNQAHFLNHGVPAKKMSPSLYGTVDPTAGMSEDDKRQLREKAREDAGVGSEALVVGFAGKFISKKNPELLFEMLPLLDPRIRRRLHLYFVGSGELEAKLRQAADRAARDFGVHSHFAGFVNQSQLAKHYCAMDIFVLPSRRAGETWGLVVNEALQCGCAAVVSTAVGCGADFRGFERFRIFEEQSARDLAQQVASLADYERSFSWPSDDLVPYSVDSAAAEIAQALAKAPDK